MPNAPLTISMIAGLDADAVEFALDGKTRADVVGTLRDEARKEKELSTFDLGERLFQFVADELKKPLASVLEEVWKQRKELREIAEEGKNRQDIEKEVALVDHGMTWTLHPSVELRLGPKVVTTMTFDVTVELQLSGLEVVIKNATITSFKTGSLTSTVKLEYKTFPLMAPAEKKINLRGQLELPRGGIRLVA